VTVFCDVLHFENIIWGGVTKSEHVSDTLAQSYLPVTRRADRSAVDWGTALQTEKLRFRFPIRSLHFNSPDPSSRAMALG
jgi:hypothetical protein